MGNLRFKRLIFLPFTAFVVVLAFGISLAALIINQQAGKRAWREATAGIQSGFEAAIRSHSDMMAGILDAIARDEAIARAFERRDRQELLGLTRDLFAGLKARNAITHFYFSDAGRINLLRVHEPSRHGDRIDRKTTLDAERTGKVASGIELGPLGTLTLRVVAPVWRGDRLIGFIELGEEIDHVVEALRTRYDAHAMVLIDKSHLDREGWTAGMRMLGRMDADWDEFPDAILALRNGITRDGVIELLASVGTDVQIGEEWLSPVKLPVIDAGGRPIADMVIAIDRTDHHRDLATFLTGIGLAAIFGTAIVVVLFRVTLGRVETRLRRAESRVGRLGHIIDLLSERIYVFDCADGRLIEANQKARGQVNCSAEFTGLFPGPAADAFEQLRDGISPSKLVLEVPGPDGGTDELRLEYLRDHRPPLIVAVAQDVSERLRLDSELRKSMTQLALAHSDLQRMAALAAHDLQEPVRTVVSFAQLLQRRYGGQLGADADDIIGHATAGAMRMKSQVDALLSYLQIDAEPPVKNTVDCAAVLRTALASMEPATMSVGAQIDFGGLPVIEGDREELVELFRQLIDNALRFRRPDRKCVVRVEAKADKDHWLFWVADNGRGLDPQYHAQAFDIFVHFHDGPAKPGTGIGLAVARRIVERLEGRIWMEENRDGGCTVCFTVPRSDGAESGA